MLDINVDEEAEDLYKELLKIEVTQAKRREFDINDFKFNSTQKCMKMRHELRPYR